MNVLIIIFVIGLFLMGPIAFIWCYYLSSQIDELKEQKDRLEFMLQQKLFSQTKKAAALFSVTENVKEAETTETTEDILTAIQKAKEQTTEQYLSPTNDLETINDPALRTAIQWAQAVPFKPVTNNPVTNKFVSKIETPPVLSEPNPESLHPVTPSPTAAIPTTAAAPTVTESTPISESTPQVKKSQTDEEWETIYPAIPSKDGNIVWQSVELWIGRKLLGWVAVLGFIVSAALFIRHAVQSGWIGPELKVLGIAVFGMVFLGAGKYFWNNGWQRFSKMLSSTGIIVLFQAGYASFAFYKLISVSTAGVVMSLIILGSFLLSWCYTSRLLGIISILGGLAVPILLSTNTDSYTELFTYLIILNIGTVILVNLLRRSPIGFLAFWGTQIEFWLWYLRYYYTLDSIPLEKLGAVLIFQGMFYLVYLVDTTIAAIVPRVHTLPTWDDVMRAILSPIIFFGTIWQLLHNDLTFGSWLGVTAFIGAAWYSLLAVLYSRHLARTWNTNIEQKLLLYWKAAPAAATVIALGFIAIGIPLHFDAAWQALGWVTVFAGLWYFGHRQENKTFRVMAFVFITLGVLRLLFDIFDPITSDYFVPLSTRLPFFSLAELPSFTAIFIVIFITIITHRFLAAENKQSYIPSNFWTGLSGYGFMILFLSVELVQYFILRQKLYIPCYSWASILLTLLWIFGVLLLYEIGFVFHSSALQNISLFAFFIITIKMFIDFFSRGFFSEPIWNPFCPVIIVSSLILIAVAVQYRQNKQLANEIIEAETGSLSVAGIFLLLGVLSVECYQFFLHYPSILPIPMETINDTINVNVALGTLSVLWAGYALVLFVLGILFQSLFLRGCSLIVLFGALVKIVVAEIFRRPDYNIAFANPYFITMLAPVLTVMFTAVWIIRIKPAESKPECDAFLFVGLSGLMLFWIFLSVECFTYFNKNPFSIDPVTQTFIATASLPVLWGLLGGMLVVIGTAGQSVWLRRFGLLVFAATVTVILCLIMFRRPAFDIPLLNPYFLTIFIPAIIMIIAAIWRIRLYPLKDQEEQISFLTFGIFGIVLLWLGLSVECFNYFNIRTDIPNNQFLAQVSLTVFWTLLAIIGAIIAGTFQSKLFRILSVGLILLTLLKVLPLELWTRPDYLTPFLNPSAFPLCLLAITTIFVCVYLISTLDEKDIVEQNVYQIIAFTGVVFLWLVLSLECFKAVRLLQGASNEAWKAQMSLSILWSVFAGVLIFIGFIWRSPVLRWMAILLFAVTLTKILLVDMAGVHEIYRFGAVFVLAVFLSLAAWAYQRFKPELK